jgi:hypothetical protein
MESHGSSPAVEIREVQGESIVVDRTLFVEVAKYFAEKKLLHDLNDYLEQQYCFEVTIDVAFVNHLKRFLLSKKLVHDDMARLTLLCTVDGSGGGGPSGVRG